MKYKVSTGTKVTYVLNTFLLIAGLYLGKDIVICASVIIAAVLGAKVEILEAISEAKS